MGLVDQLSTVRLRNVDRHTLRAAWWALRAARHARRQLDSGGLDALALAPGPRLGGNAERGVEMVLRRRGEACVVDAAVRQAWLAGQGVRRDLIVGVSGRGLDLQAHAWLEGDPPASGAGFSELTRRPAGPRS